MIDFSKLKITKEETKLISKIAKRAVEISHGSIKHFEMIMDLEIVHSKNPLNLGGLLNATKENFWHDVFGIERYINRETGDLENCFYPGFSRLW